MSLADIQIVRPVEPLVDTINPTRPFESPMMTAERNSNQQRPQDDDLSNEKIDESNRALLKPRTLLLPFNRQIVNNDEVNYAQRNGNEMQVNKKERKFIFLCATKSLI